MLPCLANRLSALRATPRDSPNDRGPTREALSRPLGLGQLRVPGTATSTPRLVAVVEPEALVAVTEQLSVAPRSATFTV